MAQSEVFNIKAIADFSQPEKEVQRLRGKLDREINSAFRNMEKSFGQPLGHITGRVDDFASSLEASNARVIAFGASAGIVYQVSKAFRELVRSTIQVEKSMADIQVVLNANVKQLENYRSGIFRIAKETGQSFTEVSKAATELARQGLSAEKTLVRLKDALVLSRLSGMDTLDSVEALTAAINGFGETVIDSTRLVNKFAEVDQKFAVSSQDLAEAFKRVGSTAVDAGVSIDELIALVTTAQQITARGGSVIGNSFKTIFTRVQRPQVLEDLENAGIKVRDFAGESLKAVDILRNLANGYDKLASSQKSFVSEAVGGVFQINVLKALLKDIDGEFSIFARALDSSANASDAAAKKNEMLNKTLDSLINKSTENLREFAVTLGELTVKPVIVKTLTAINAVVEYIINNKEEFAGVFDTIGKFVSGPVFGLVIGSMIRLFAGFSKFAISAAAQIAGLTKRQEDVARIQNMISNILISQPELYQRIVTGAISVQQAERETLTILRQQAAERNKMMNFASGAAAHAFSSGARVNTRRKNVSFPNFADPIRQAVDREVGSGIPRSAIRIAVDNRLKSPNNPQGLGVYNTIDEPLGISQGINRSRQMGIDPRTHGIPNFASSKKRIYNPQTGKFESLIVDDQSGRLTDPSTGKVVGNLYFQQPESVLDPSKSKGRDLYKERQSQIQRDQAREAARLAGEMTLYSQGLRKDPLMLPAGSVGGLTRVKGKSRDRYAEYIAGKSTINLPESITQFNESQRIAEVAKKTAEDLAKANKDSIARMEKILSASQSQESLLTAPPSGPSSINPFGYATATIINNPNKRASQSGEYIIGGSTPQTLISAGSEFIGPRMPIQVPEQKAGTRRFFDEFRRVLTDPKVARSEKQNMIDAVSRGIEKGRMVSVKGLSEKLGEDYSVSSYKSFLKEFENTSQQFNKDQREALKNLIYQQGLNAPTMPLLQSGGLSFRERRSTFSLGTDPLAISRALSMVPLGETDKELIKRMNRRDQGYYAKSQRTGRLLPISQTRYNRLQEAQRKRDRSLKRGSEFVPVTVPTQFMTPKYGTPAPSIQELLTDPRYLNPDRGDTQTYAQKLAATYPNAPASQLGTMIVGKQPTKPAWYSMPTFAAAARGIRSRIGGASGLYTRMRDMDPMNKMLLLGGVGAAASFGTSAYERSVASDQSLSGLEKKNRTMISGAIGNTLTGAMIGGSLTAGTGIGMFGGAAIGGIVAAAFSINDILKNWNDILPDLETNLQKTVTKVQELSDVSQGISAVLFKLSNPPEFKTEEERKQFASEIRRELKTQISRRGPSGASKLEIIKGIESSKSVEEAISRVNQILSEEVKKNEPKLAIEELTTSIIKSQREGQSIDFTPILSKVRSRIGGTIGEASSSISIEERQKLRSDLQKALGTVGLIENKALTRDPFNESIYNGIIKPSAGQGPISNVLNIISSAASLVKASNYDQKQEISAQKSPEILSIIGNTLQSIGVDRTTKNYTDIMKSLGESTKDGSDSLKSFILALKNLIPTTDDAESSIEKLIDSSIKTIDKVKNFRERDIGFMREDREFKLSMNQRAYERSKSINIQNFLKEGQILSNQGVSMLPAMRDIRQLQIGRRTENTIAELNRQGIFDQFSSDVRTQRTKLRESFFGREMGDQEVYYNQVYDTIVSAIESGGRDSVPSISSFLEDEIRNAESLYINSGKQAYLTQKGFLEDLQASLQSNKNQIDAVNEALAQNNSLSKTREEMLRKQFDLQYAQGDFLRSQSATRNAERRALEGSDPKTEITSAMRAFREEMGYTVNDFYTDFENSARDAAQTFKSEFKSAFNDFRRGTLSAGEALRQMAMNVLDRIATNASNMAIDSLLNAAFGGASRIFSNVQARRSGGMVRKRYADGGTVVGGSGVVDDVPAMLTSGEYVINRDAVRTYGSDFFRKINQGRGATGTLENQYLFLDDQGNVSANPTRGEARISAALSNIGATNDLMRANTDRFAREQRFVSYVQARRQYDAQRTAAIKQYERGIRQQAIGAGVSAGIGIGGAALGNYFDSRQIASGGAYGVPMGNASQYSNVANSGSIVPRIGSSNRDTMGYSLTGGEAIIRKEAVNMYGPQYVNDLNNGRAKTMRFGGSNPESSIGEIRNLPSSIDRLAMSIDSLGSRSGSNDSRSSEGTITNQFSFNIEVNASNGQATASENNTNNQQQDSGVSQEDYKKIGEATKIVALQAIQENLRSGGMIYNAIRGR